MRSPSRHTKEPRNALRDQVRIATKRARRFHRPGSFTEEDWLGLCAYLDWRCGDCKRRAKLYAVHMTPLRFRSARNDIWNIIPLCHACRDSYQAWQEGR